jgi:hypothetical protein
LPLAAEAQWQQRGLRRGNDELAMFVLFGHVSSTPARYLNPEVARHRGGEPGQPATGS